MDTSIPLKRCSQCKQEWPATPEYFNRRSRSKSGLRSECKACRNDKEWVKLHPPAPKLPRYKDGLKRCIACGVYKPLTPENFYRSVKYPDGFKDRCKACRKTANPIVVKPDTTKRCKNCQNEYPCTVKYFWPNPEARDGLGGVCRQCKNAYVAARRQANHEEYYKYMRAYRRRWEQNNKEHVRKYKQEYRRSHPEVMRRKSRKYARTHREKYRNDWQKRRARKNAIQGSYTPEQIIEQLKRQHYRCYYLYCGQAKLPQDTRRTYGYRFHIEHTFPISRVAGMDIPANDMGYIVLSCELCNRTKGDKFPWEWPEGGRLL